MTTWMIKGSSKAAAAAAALRPHLQAGHHPVADSPNLTKPRSQNVQTGSPGHMQPSSPARCLGWSFVGVYGCPAAPILQMLRGLCKCLHSWFLARRLTK